MSQHHSRRHRNRGPMAWIAEQWRLILGVGVLAVGSVVVLAATGFFQDARNPNAPVVMSAAPAAPTLTLGTARATATPARVTPTPLALATTLPNPTPAGVTQATPTAAPIVAVNTPSRSVTSQPDCNGAPPTPPSDPTVVVERQAVVCLVRASANMLAVPSDIVPFLAIAEDDYGLPAGAAQQCIADTSVIELPACTFGDANGEQSVVLLGDSFAYMWLPAFDVIGKRMGWKVTLLSKSACLPIYIDTYNELRKAPFPECDRWHDYAIGRINAAHPDLVVISSSSGGKNSHGDPISGPDWAAAMERTLGLLDLPGDRKVLLGSPPNPVLANNQVAGPTCLAAHLSNVQACSVPLEVAVGATSQPLQQAAAAQAGARYLDTNPLFCSSICTALVGRMNVYVHNGHVSASYARFLSGAIQTELEPSLRSTN